MSNASNESSRLEVHTAVDPEIPAPVAESIRREPAQSRVPAEESEEPKPGSVVARGALTTLGLLGGWAVTGFAVDGVAEQPVEVLHALFSLSLPIPALATAFRLRRLGRRADRRPGRRPRATADEYRDRFVRPDQLTAEGQVLLARAQRAVKAVLTSSVLAEDLIDRRRNELALPAQEWDIAKSLAEYTRLERAVPESPGGQEQHVQDIEALRNDIEREVEQLERYAHEVLKAEARYARWRREPAAEELARLKDEAAALNEALAAVDPSSSGS
ncbi:MULTISPECIES: hypothetical protein [unclassified Streptomyces]|uniref:hypothetical protein n=1 Tax=unclassified Streptomyces TaxID=2593676 RepID=UPI002365A19B|nr:MULTISPECIES: hypothetical protein [unclassified Streptomyces]MDF3139974.1 hypothetical protein [Streptomyces sp. T21Q-yed]WDF39886.1 hypothetical protein PBV52_25370 [Streptomyces sp. T12]